MKTAAASARITSVMDYLQLTKPRITFLVILTTFIGFLLGSKGPIEYVLLFHTILGTALVAAGASALNMVLESDADARMRRTENRPIPSGRLTSIQALSFGAILSAAGLLYLVIFVNPLTSALAAVTLVLYLFAYTPLKRKTSLCTVVGAIPGAIPPMMGWTAVQGSIGFQALWLFSILFLWQLPHFLAIGWLYRDDYARGGFPMLSVTDTECTQTSRQVIVNTIALIAVSLLPAFIGLSGKIYFAGSLVLGILFLMMGIRLSQTKSSMSARQLLLASVLYLPLLLSLLVLDQTL
ncbi:MAG TPA: heme o synthase [Acidobacteriota bacterium]|nr:heme o synthase [Acidobacteriota bacterium]